MTFVMILRLVCAVLACAFTVVGAVLFGRACLILVARMRLGRPAPERLRPVGARTLHMVTRILGHSSFRGRPWIRVAHWLVMVSFPLLFLTLVTGYGKILGGPTFALPWLDRQPWWNWLVELIAWLSLAGIVGLSLVRVRLTARGHAQPPFAGTSEGGTRTRTPRFSGSSARQALFVEAVIALVVLCVLALRMLEATHAGLSANGAAAGGSVGIGSEDSAAVLAYYPFTAWATPLLRGLGLSGVEAGIILIATLKVLVSITWMVVVGLQPSMGVAWHRFLAFVNIYARRSLTGTHADPSRVHVDLNLPDGNDDAAHPAQATTDARLTQTVPAARLGANALGPAQPLVFQAADGTPTTLTAHTLDDLDTAMDAAEEAGEQVRLGVGRINDFTWKGLLDFSSCTECGRCQDLCPAWNTGKPLSPKLFTLALRDHHAAAAPFLAAAASLGVDPEEVTDEQAAAHGGLLRGSRAGLAPDSAHTADVLGALLAAQAAPTDTGVATRLAPLAGEVIPADVLWSCTTCGACVDQCPVDIEHVDHIIDIRRQQVLMESAFPRELGQMFRKLESKGNPWGLAPRKRLEWTQGLDFDVPVIGVDVEDATAVDYLLWVGCAGAYDDRAKKTTRAVAQLLHIAGVSFAVLGDAESCTGDPARRAGNEILFQMLAGHNIETLNEAKARSIVVTCAHCFNTLAREYPQAGGHYTVLHHTQLLARLVRHGALRPAPAPDAHATITFHDPCYLGRHNEIYTPPRELLAATGATTVDMPRTRERALCCGGGGARAFMEETIGTRIAAERSREAAGTRANVIATACPFCTTMLAGAAAGEDSDMRVADVATLMLEAVQRSALE